MSKVHEQCDEIIWRINKVEKWLSYVNWVTWTMSLLILWVLWFIFSQINQIQSEKISRAEFTQSINEIKITIKENNADLSTRIENGVKLWLFEYTKEFLKDNP